MSTGKTFSTKYILDSNDNKGAEGQVLSSTSSGIDWVDLTDIPALGDYLPLAGDLFPTEYPVDKTAQNF